METIHLFFFFSFFPRDNRILSRKKVNTAGRVGPKETDYSALICPTCNMLLDLSDLSRILSEEVACNGIVGPTTAYTK